MSFDHTLKKSTTSKIIEFILRDSTTGQGKTGLASGDMSGAYVREGSTYTSLSFSAGSAGDSYSSGKFAEVDATNMAGVYQFHLPNAVLATGADSVTIRFGASGVIDKIIRICLLDVDLRDADNAGLADVAAILVDTGTTIPATLTTLSTFNAGADTVTVSQNNDKTGYSISGTKTTLDQLNDIAATSIVSGGAINTSSGAVSTVDNVVLCDTTTTNSDMRGTDSALLASSAPTNFAAMLITGGGAITVGTNNDKVNYSISGTKTTLDDLNDLDAASVNSEVDTALSDIGLDHLVSASVAGADVADNSIVAKMVSKNATADWDTFTNTDDSLEAIRDRGDSSWTPSGGLTAAEIADAVLDEALSGHVSAGSLGKAIADIESDATAILVDTGTTLPASIATIDTEVGEMQSDVTAISNDTSTIITDIATLDGKVDTVDGIVDAILVDTGTTIPATLAGLSTLDAAGVRTAVGLATNNLDTQLGNLPTTTEFNARTLVSSAYFDPATDSVTVGTNNDKTDYALSEASRQAIGDDFLSHTITKGSAGTIERAFWQALKSNATIDGEIEGSPTASAFDTNLTLVDDAIEHLMLVIVSGSLQGEARPILSYSQTNGRIVLQESLSATPSATDEFLVVPYHVHPLSEITDANWNALSSSYSVSGSFGAYLDAAVSSVGGGSDAAAIADAVWDESRSGHTDAGTFGYYLDAQVSGISGGGVSASAIWGALMSDYATAGTFGARFQEADRYTNTTANIIYVNQGDAYDDTANNAIAWEVSKDYSGADSLTLVIEHRVTGAVLLSHAVTYIDATTLKAYLSSSDTAFSTLTTDADFGVHPYRVEADYSGEVQTVVRGAVTIRQS